MRALVRTLYKYDILNLMSYCSRCQRKFPLNTLQINTRGKNRDYYYCRSCSTKRRKAHRSTPKGKRLAREAVYRSIRKHPEKQAARVLLNLALAQRIVLKPPHCRYKKCLERKTEAHHADYTKPLKVIWLCRPHHSLLHRELLH